MLNRKIIFLLLFLAVSVPLIWYFQHSSSPAPRNIKIEFSFGAEETVFYSAMEDSLNKTIEDYGIDVDINYSYAYTNALLQSTNIQEGIKREPDIFVVMPQDSKKIVSSIEDIQAAGIPIIMYNRPSDPKSVIQPTAYVGLDTYNQAYTTAVALFKLMKEDGVEPQVLNLMGNLADRNAVLRKAGLYAAAKEMNALIIADIETFWEPEKAEENLEQAIINHPEGNAVFCSSDWIIPGVENTLRKFDRWYPYGHPRHMYLGSQDVYPLGLEYVKSGYIDVNTAFDLSPMSLMLLQVILLILNDHELSQTSYLIPGRIVTKNNLDSITGLWSETFGD